MKLIIMQIQLWQNDKQKIIEEFVGYAYKY